MRLLFAAALVLLGGCRGCERRDLGVVTESTRARLDEKLPPSAIFDGATVRLRGVRGEVLGVQVRAPRDTEARLELPAAVARVEGFAIRAVTVREPSTDMFGPSRGAGAYPDLLEPAGAGVRVADGALFDVTIAGDAPPGRHTGTLTAGARTFPVELLVERTHIDLRMEPLVWGFYLPGEIARLHGVADDDGEPELTWERRYAELARAHGVYLASDQPAARVPPRAALMEGVRYWPVSVELSSDDAIREGVRAHLEVFAGRPQIPVLTPVDEPSTPEARARARRACEVARAAGDGRLLCAVTASPHPELDGPFDAYFSLDATVAPPRPGVKIWTYNGRPPRAGSVVIDGEGGGLRTWGWLAERYGLELWYAWETLYVRDRYNEGPGAKLRVPDDPLTFDERRGGKGQDRGNGDGLLLYPGPRPSLRLKVLRRGLQDRLLVRALRACDPAAADRIVRETIPRGFGEATTPSWPPDERAWEAARARLLDALSACP